MKGFFKSTIVVLSIIQLVVMMVKPGQATDCNQVDTSIGACIGYLTSGGNPSEDCCNGVKNLKTNTPTAEDKKAACYCLKEAANRYHIKFKDDAASSLPQKCGVDIDINITKGYDCNKIN